ncbi:hypothetical protein Dimus_028660, partial [Dionaea muscipula]
AAATPQFMHPTSSSNCSPWMQHVEPMNQQQVATSSSSCSVRIEASSGSQQLCKTTKRNGPLRSPTPATHESTVGQCYDEVSSIHQRPSREQLEQQQLNQALVKISGEQFSGEVAHDRGLQSRA